jgi:ADP-ribose pyrophosphatase YjhB (NUDIX family)
MTESRTHQVAALPWRHGSNGVEILLVTSRETNRWIVPKGWPHKGIPLWQSAETEALEEAGVVGKIEISSIGTFKYDKKLREGSLRTVTVSVFALKVDREHAKWPEETERRRRWFAYAEAATIVQEPELRQIIESLPRSRILR